MLIYAQPGNGRRASLFTDYTFGVWDEGKLVPFAKAYSGLTDAEIREVDPLVRRNTSSVRPGAHVEPELVFELGFEGISARRGTAQASRCAFRACSAGGTTRGRGGRHAGDGGRVDHLMHNARCTNGTPLKRPACSGADDSLGPLGIHSDRDVKEGLCVGWTS